MIWSEHINLLLFVDAACRWCCGFASSNQSKFSSILQITLSSTCGPDDYDSLVVVVQAVWKITIMSYMDFLCFSKYIFINGSNCLDAFKRIFKSWNFLFRWKLWWHCLANFYYFYCFSDKICADKQVMTIFQIKICLMYKKTRKRPR